MTAIKISPLEFHLATALPKPRPYIAYAPGESINNEAVELYRLQGDPARNKIDILHRGVKIREAADYEEADRIVSEDYARCLSKNFQAGPSDYLDVTSAIGGAFEELQNLQDDGVDEDSLDRIRNQIRTLAEAALQGMVATGTASLSANHAHHIALEDVDDTIENLEAATKRGGMTY